MKDTKLEELRASIDASLLQTSSVSGSTAPVEDTCSGTEELARYIFDPFAEYPDPTPLVLIGGAMAFTLGTTSAISGGIGSMKSHLIALIVSKYIADDCDPCDIVTASRPDTNRVLWIDTEQNASHIKTLFRKVCGLSGLSREQVKERLTIAMLLQAETPEERLRLVSKYIDAFTPTLVFIDGTSEMISDANSLEQAQSLQEYLLKLAQSKNLHICQVIHTNPITAKNQVEKARGHLGSEAMRKVDVMLNMQKNERGAVSVGYIKQSRYGVLPDFELYIDDDGLPRVRQTIVQASANARTSKKKDIVKDIFANEQGASRFLSYTELVNALVGSGAYKTERSARDFISKNTDKPFDGILHALIAKNKDGEYFAPWLKD